MAYIVGMDKRITKAGKPREVHLYLSPELFDLIVEAANREALTLTAYIRSVAIKAARQALDPTA